MKQTLALVGSEEESPAPRQKAHPRNGKGVKLPSSIEVFPENPKKKGTSVSPTKAKKIAHGASNRGTTEEKEVSPEIYSTSQKGKGISFQNVVYT